MSGPMRMFRTTAAVVGVLLLLALPAYRFLYYAPTVEVVEATEGTVARAIHGPGTVQARYPLAVSARITATVIHLYADQGDTVRRGQLLAQLDDRDLAARDAAAGTDLVLARANFQRDHEVFEKGYISQAAIDATIAALRAAEARGREAAAALSYTRITAPVEGVITAREAEVGHTVGPGGTLFRVVDPSALWVVARIDEAVVGQVTLGQSATIALRTGSLATGSVARIALESDAATRELEVAVAFDAPPERFAVNQEAEITIHAGEERGIVLPVSAVFQQSRALGVMVVADGRTAFRPVKSGTSDGDLVIVSEGLAAGEQVVRRPAGVKAGKRVHAVPGGAR
ncbi:MAG: efflux RND transporter periplasmic adaptor subunit [Longimicrobiales bacterium]